MANTSQTTAPLSERPSHFEPDPDRHEVINLVRDATSIELAPGVVFRPLVSAHNGARNLTTGLVTVSPSGELPYHTHAFTESVTVLSGEAVMEVAGARYLLGPLDNIVLPPQTPHFLVNESAADTLIHIAMPVSEPSRTLVEDTFIRQETAPDSLGREGGEHVLRFATAPRYESNAGATFINFFNRDLGCDEMSGGYGVFTPGAQLPCHLHDFDESITIVQGDATCFVEGNRHILADNATALVPRGRCHYFINESDGPMAMVWVYAGPMPERLELEESLCKLPWTNSK